MWQAISRLLSEQLGEGEIELRNELPGGEVHAAWHLRYAGRDFFVKCDERDLLSGFTAEADQLELLSRSKTVTVPRVWAVGADRDYSFLVMDYLPPRPLDAHNAFILGQQIARLHQWSDQPQFGLDFDNALSTTPQPNTWQRRWATFFAEQRIGWQLELAAEKGIAFGNIDAIVEHIQQRLASHQPQPSLLHGDLWSGNCALGPNMARTFSIPLVTGATESAIWRCCRCTLNNRRKSMTAISQFHRYRQISSNVNQFTSSTRYLIVQGCLAGSIWLLLSSHWIDY